MSAKATTDRLLHAVKLHQAGLLAEAGAMYDDVLKSEPRNLDALNLRGLIAHAQQDWALAEKLLSKALKLNPRFAAAHCNLGNTYLALGRTADAVKHYKFAINNNSNFADARLNLGVAYFKARDLHAAQAAFADMAAHHPGDVRAHKNLGLSLFDLGEFAQAEAAFNRALELNPSELDAIIKLASLNARAGRLNEAINFIRRAIALAPQNGEHHSNLGTWLSNLGQHAEAYQAHATARALDPRRAEFAFNFGNAYYAAGQLADAAVQFEETLSLNPQFVDGYVNLAEVFKDQARPHDAIALLDKAIALMPAHTAARVNKAAVINEDANQVPDDVAVAKFDEALANLAAGDSAPGDRVATITTNKALALLASGQYAEGWRLYGERFALGENHIKFRAFPYPKWQGQPAPDKKILLWTDQGPGDEIIYASMIARAKQNFAACMLECSPRLVDLFQRSFPDVEVVKQQTPPDPRIEAFKPDFQTDVVSLGEVYRLKPSDFPLHRGYLKADSARVTQLRSSYEAIAKGRLIVGVSWKSANPKSGTSKTLPIPQWGPVFENRDVLFVSLQYGDVAQDLEEVHQLFGQDVLHDTSVDPMRDLDGFAAQVAAMDLVISVSNTTVHFAGALNIPVWTLLSRSKGALWYFRSGERTVWYPAMRLFRQSKAGDWSDVVANVGGQLHRATQRSRAE